MTFNFYVLLSIVLGETIGYFIYQADYELK